MTTLEPDHGAAQPPSKRRKTAGGASPGTLHRELGVMRSHGASFVGSASGIHFVRSVYNAVDSSSPAVDRSSNQEIVPGEEDQLQDGTSGRGSDRLWRPNETYHPAEGQQVSFEELVAWSQAYFDHWHPVLPFLHAPSFLDWCDSISQLSLDEVKGFSPLRLTIMRVVLSMSLADRRQANNANPVPAIPAALVFESFEEAVSSVQAVLVATSSLESLQAAVSVQLFLISMLRHNAASRIGGIIIRLLFQMGVHRCPHRYSNFTTQDRIFRQRIFWSVYCLDRYICQCLGIPLTLRDDDIDVCMPDNEQHAVTDGVSPAVDSRMMLLCLCSKHSRIKGRVLELCNKSINHRHFDESEVTRTRTMIAKWSNDVENAAEVHVSERNSLAPLHTLMLEVFKNESIIALNRPMLSNTGQSEDYESALQACVASSRAIIQALSRHLQSTPLVWPSFTWAAWMSGFIIVFAMVKHEIPTAVGLSLVDQCADVLDHLAARNSTWPVMCAKVIRDLSLRIQQSSQHSTSSAQLIHPRDGQHAADDTDRRDRSSDPTLPAFGGGWDGLAQDLYGHTFEPFERIDLFQGFDIPFWLSDEQYADPTSFPNW